MTTRPHNPFDSLESSYEYVCLLHEALEESRATIDVEVAQALTMNAPRRVSALQLVTYKLDRLDQHLRVCRRLLNDLRTLRRMLLGEREAPPPTEQTEDVAGHDHEPMHNSVIAGGHRGPVDL